MTDKVIDLFSEILVVEPDQLSAETSPANTPEWDSLANMMLIAGIEETFAVELSTGEIERMKTIGDVQAILRERNVALN